MVRSSLTFEAAKTLVHAFVSSRLDYCNSLLYGIGDGLLTKLQTTGQKLYKHKSSSHVLCKINYKRSSHAEW